MNQQERPFARKLALLTAGVLLAQTLIACGGAPVPNEQLTAAESRVAAAQQGGAADIPRGELHLKYARDQIADAKALIAEGKNELAKYALERAEVDAELALALAEEEEARQEAQKELERIQEMMEQ